MSRIKSKGKNIFKIICLMLVTVIASVSISSLLARNEGKNLFVNDKNLVHTLEEYESKAGNTGDGLSWKVNSSGSITVNGTYSKDAETNVAFVLGTVTIEEEDYYTLSGAKKGSTDTFYIEATYEDSAGNSKTLISDFSNKMTSDAKLAVGTQVTIRIVVKPGSTLNYYTIKPTLVAGTEAGRF